MGVWIVPADILDEKDNVNRSVFYQEGFATYVQRLRARLESCMYNWLRTDLDHVAGKAQSLGLTVCGEPRDAVALKSRLLRVTDQVFLYLLFLYLLFVILCHNQQCC